MAGWVTTPVANSMGPPFFNGGVANEWFSGLAPQAILQWAANSYQCERAQCT